MPNKENFYDQLYKIETDYTTYFCSDIAEVMLQVAIWLHNGSTITIKMNPDQTNHEPVDPERLANMCIQILGGLKP